MHKNFDRTAINASSKVNKETGNLKWGRPQPEETSKSLILKEHEFCERKNSMLSVQNTKKF